MKNLDVVLTDNEALVLLTALEHDISTTEIVKEVGSLAVPQIYIDISKSLYEKIKRSLEDG